MWGFKANQASLQSAPVAGFYTASAQLLHSEAASLVSDSACPVLLKCVRGEQPTRSGGVPPLSEAVPA